MKKSSSLLLKYEAIADISGQMLEQASSNNWDTVLELSERYCKAVESLRELEPLEHEDRIARQSLLTKILSDDACIRNLAAPELARLGGLLGTMKRHQNVLQAYYAPSNSLP